MKLLKVNAGYNEITQAVDMSFATVYEKDGEFHQLHSWFKCTDFLNEAVISSFLGKELSIYGFTAKSDMQYWHNKGGHLLVKCPKELFGLTLINDLERLGGLKGRSKVVETEHNVFLCRLPPPYFTSPLFLHLWCFTVRLQALLIKDQLPAVDLNSWESVESNKGSFPMSNKDYQFINMCKPNLLMNILKFREFFKIKPEHKVVIESDSVSWIHNRSGIKTLNQALTTSDMASKILQIGLPKFKKAIGG